MSGRVRSIAERVIHETIDDEVIILNLDTGMYYSARQAGAQIWDLLAGGSSLESVVDEMVQRYRGTRDAVEAAVRSFLGELVSEALLLVEGTMPLPAMAGVEAMAMQGTDLPFSWPRLDRHADLKRFFLLYA